MHCRYGGCNYQGKDMSHIQKVLSTRFADIAAGSGFKAHFARMSLADLPRGGEGGEEGDAIRSAILALLHKNGIQEGHRPGIECTFLAQVTYSSRLPAAQVLSQSRHSPCTLLAAFW
jgi:hypothetical protein